MHFACCRCSSISGRFVISGEVRAHPAGHGALVSGVLALTLNAALHLGDLPAGIQSIDRGQSEAARSLGLSFPRTMSKCAAAGLPPHVAAAWQQRHRLLKDSPGLGHRPGGAGYARAHGGRRLSRYWNRTSHLGDVLAVDARSLSGEAAGVHMGEAIRVER